MPTTDILVIGSGIAGLSFAVKCAAEAPDRTITILTKCDASESNTKYAQGGMAVVMDQGQDSYDKHIQDTITAGAGHCDPEIVRLVVEEGPKRLQEMIKWGANFDLEHGRMRLGREGGHSVNRIVHRSDVTGYEMEKALLAKIAELPNVQLLPHQFAVELILDKQGNRCCGASAIDKANNILNTYHSLMTVVSSGGMGRVYGMTTNPEIATGDGIAMAYQAGAEVKDMEFIQFHPTALYSEETEPTFLISEAVRGEGAILTDIKGKPFMSKYHKDADLAPRDIVSKAIFDEVQQSDLHHVFLDCRLIEEARFMNHFPTIYARCLRVGIDPLKDLIPVAPAAHYVCGGIVTDAHGQTSINSLYAIGECARTGLHGANRLASNSLLEALVFGHRAAKKVASLAPTIANNCCLETAAESTNELTEEQRSFLAQTKQELLTMMSDKVGIVRTTSGLKEAKAFIENARDSVKKNFDTFFVNHLLLELDNLLTVAGMIIDQSLSRTSNLGGYFNKDLVD